MLELREKIKDAASYIKKALAGRELPQIGLVLGSGLGSLAEEIEETVILDYAEIPYFPVSTVAGHAGRLVIGLLSGKRVMAMQGRFHYYEGYSLQEVTFPIRVMQALGIKELIVTNACGGMNPTFAPGDLLLISDHINFIGSNPLIGPNLEEFGPRFPDMSEAYSRRLRALARQVAGEQGVKLQEGVYVPVSGPNYCTPAELIFLRQIGGDAVGMSTVPEVIVANHGGMEVLGIACVTDMAIGEHLEKLEHEQVVAVAEQARPRFIQLIKGILAAM
ncbi:MULTISPECIES: purine-nucleoside phosphorylase [unclassified Carboxydocella]|uniref:purine-nucleoside phosphorylase n=1 Tax=unclassified Carboxydocella TaxID=2685367 RepID=UPI0009AC8E4D|nr:MULTISPECIES: purine-nucleoside phosphorylase [unclassified Carboxydocella]GAW27847.1 purine-nucleoside phosphorylase [Carboxydocella sp. ULO1]GAW32668.1 purine-nucleoside phosphorylase [Carboxydocella sp. JDF658]